ncbi:Txe/YoeB family addiction module toxin [Synergistales bacterium]|nr:Txe/YoeB family addiction module toxin [Synergistales bacterium]GHV57991.1 Txe/YoeB family addiction module toxin [Synergistales bacterium]
MGVTFDDEAFAQYIAWQTEDKKTVKKINSLIQSIRREGAMGGIGKPERLKNVATYSRRIDEKNRLVYIIADNGDVKIYSCKGHYKDI